MHYNSAINNYSNLLHFSSIKKPCRNISNRAFKFNGGSKSFKVCLSCVLMNLLLYYFSSLYEFLPTCIYLTGINSKDQLLLFVPLRKTDNSDPELFEKTYFAFTAYAAVWVLGWYISS